MATYTPFFNLKKPAGTEDINVDDINGNMDAIDTALSTQESITKMKKISCTSMSDFQTKLTSLMASIPTEYAIELVLVTTPGFDIFLNGTHSFTFHKLASNYWWGYGFINGKLAIISNAAGSWKTAKYGEVLVNTSSESQTIFLERNGNLYHLHYVQMAPVANGATVTSISSGYAPTGITNGYAWYKQPSGYSYIACRLDTSGSVSLWASTYNEPVAGVFDLYWER